MIKKSTPRLTLDRSVTYQIKVPGELDLRCSKFNEGMRVTVESVFDGLPISTFTGAFDQAALQSYLRLLYSLELPLISVS